MRKRIHIAAKAQHKHHAKLERFGLAIAAFGLICVIALGWRWPGISLMLVTGFGLAAMALRIESSIVFRLALVLLGVSAVLSWAEQDVIGEHLAVCAFILLVFGTLQIVAEQVLAKITIRKGVDHPKDPK